MAVGFTTKFTNTSTGRPARKPMAVVSRPGLNPQLKALTNSEKLITAAEVRSLKKSYGNHLAVKDVSFSIHQGEVLGLLGPNGAGKSTTMMMLAGLLAPTDGEVLLAGEHFDGRNHDQRRLLGVVPQEYAIYQELSAIDNLMFFGKLYGLSGPSLKTRCDEVLEQIGLVESARRPSETYSGGMKRRLNFGVALMHRPSILILDEPTVGVDPQSRSHLLDCVRSLAATGVAVIYASHYMEEVQSICQRVAIIDQGVVLANDTIANLVGGTAADLYLTVNRTQGVAEELGNLAQLGTGSDGQPAVIIAGNIPVTKRPPLPPSTRCGLGTLSDNVEKSVPDLSWRLQTVLFKLGTMGIRVERIETQQSNLERLFLQLTGKRLRD